MKIIENRYVPQNTPSPDAPPSPTHHFPTTSRDRPQDTAATREHIGQNLWYWTHLDTLQQSALHFEASVKPAATPPPAPESVPAPPHSTQVPDASEVMHMPETAPNRPAPEHYALTSPPETSGHKTVSPTPVRTPRTPVPPPDTTASKPLAPTRTTPPWRASPVGLWPQPTAHNTPGMHIHTDGNSAEIALTWHDKAPGTRTQLAGRLRNALRAIGVQVKHLFINGESL